LALLDGGANCNLISNSKAKSLDIVPQVEEGNIKFGNTSSCRITHRLFLALTAKYNEKDSGNSSEITATAALQGDITTASDLKQGNTCINVLDLGRDGSCIVRALDVRDHLRELQTTGRS
jgi:hypothetical protein